MIAIFLAPVYAAVIFYITKRTLQWIGECINPLKAAWFRTAFTILLIIFASSPIAAFFIPDIGLPTVLVRRLSTYWLGVLLYTVMFLLIADIIAFALKKTKVISSDKKKLTKAFKILGLCVAACIALMSTYGHINAHNLKSKTYDVKVNKESGSGGLTIALAADLHLGYSIGPETVKNMVEKINDMDADVVILAGDIFDNDFNAISYPEKIIGYLKEIKSRYGVYACYGNHDVNEKLLFGFTFKTLITETSGSQMDDFLKEANIRLLRDEAVLIDNRFYLVGRRDYSKPGTDSPRLSPEELISGLDKTKPIFVIDHQPRELEELAAAGADLDLSGHTHDGQLFPANIITGLLWENSCGLLKEGNMTSIVTSGVGLFGPDMRTFTDSEVIKLNVEFE